MFVQAIWLDSALYNICTVSFSWLMCPSEKDLHPFACLHLICIFNALSFSSSSLLERFMRFKPGMCTYINIHSPFENLFTPKASVFWLESRSWLLRVIERSEIKYRVRPCRQSGTKKSTEVSRQRSIGRPWCSVSKRLIPQPDVKMAQHVSNPENHNRP